jgi:hypothetical protein
LSAGLFLVTAQLLRCCSNWNPFENLEKRQNAANSNVFGYSTKLPKLRTWVRFPSPGPDSPETNHLGNAWLHFSTWLQFNCGTTFDALGQHLYGAPLPPTPNKILFGMMLVFTSVVAFPFDASEQGQRPSP